VDITNRVNRCRPVVRHLHDGNMIPDVVLAVEVG
jgi:hypothetical protein